MLGKKRDPFRFGEANDRGTLDFDPETKSGPAALLRRDRKGPLGASVLILLYY